MSCMQCINFVFDKFSFLIIYYRNLLTIAIFYGLPVVQLVINYQKVRLDVVLTNTTIKIKIVIVLIIISSSLSVPLPTLSNCEPPSAPNSSSSPPSASPPPPPQLIDYPCTPKGLWDFKFQCKPSSRGIVCQLKFYLLFC